MTIISLLLTILFVFLVGYAAYWLINRFIPVGLPRTVALVIVGIVLLIYLLSGVGLIGGATGLLATPVG
jgi:uncharacterized membrane protein (DUF485 family)